MKVLCKAPNSLDGLLRWCDPVIQDATDLARRIARRKRLIAQMCLWNGTDQCWHKSDDDIHDSRPADLQLYYTMALTSLAISCILFYGFILFRIPRFKTLYCCSQCSDQRVLLQFESRLAFTFRMVRELFDSIDLLDIDTFDFIDYDLVRLE